MKPTVGRIVHYYNLGDAEGRFPSAIPQASLVAFVHPLDALGKVSLVVFYANDLGGGFFTMPRVPYAVTPTPGCWSWPPLEPADHAGLVAAAGPEVRGI